MPPKTKKERLAAGAQTKKRSAGPGESGGGGGCPGSGSETKQPCSRSSQPSAQRMELAFLSFFFFLNQQHFY